MSAHTARFPSLSTRVARRRHLPHCIQPQPQSRTFLTPPLQRITARRTLPHPPQPIYAVIAAVPAYARFLPYCLASRVTRWSPRADATLGLRWPDEAELEVGWGAVRERFTSRIYCAPARRVVEAVGGGARTTLAHDDVAHHERWDGSRERAGQEGVLTHLLTRWTVTPVAEGDAAGAGALSEVGLDIEFQFSNPVYAAMSSAVADRVAESMIEAFEARVKSELRDNTEWNGKIEQISDSG
jgi:coenzyme Q-binding protein COQ10